jgi:CRP-like cAMP-binding protein
VPASDKLYPRTRISKNRIKKLGSTMANGRTGSKAANKEAFDTEAFLTTVGTGRTITTHKAKSYIFRQGTNCDAVFYIQNGHVELSVVSQQGKERVVGMLGPGSFIGEGCLAGHPSILRRRGPPPKLRWPAWTQRHCARP